MHFASGYVLEEEEDVYEAISDEEYDRGMTVSDSDSDDGAAPLPPPPPGAARLASALSPSASKKKKSKPKKKSHWKSFFSSKSAGKKADAEVKDGLNKRWFRQADTNVVCVKFDTLLSPGNMHAGDPVLCTDCGAVLSHVSKLQQLQSQQQEEGAGDAGKMWTCEFCGHPCPVDITEEEIPQTEDVTYLLEPALSTSSQTQDDNLVIFVMDTSGSMCVTTEVQGQIKLRGTAHLQRLQSFNLENEEQFLPSQRGRDVTYISRLQAMQAAVDHQLEEMAKSHPHRKVGLVAFNNEVTVVGDGSHTEVTFAGDKLTKVDQLENEASELVLNDGISKSRKVLGDKIYKMEEGGATALGPALTVAVSMASHRAGSKVILCTDGKANIGLGNLEEAEEAAMDFYGAMGDKALAQGVTISVITISGTDCKLVHLGQLADKTGGQVNIVDPLKLREEFANILADPVIATKVKATFILYKDLYIVDERDPKKRDCRDTQLIGNAYSSSNITFQFARKKDDPTYDNVKKGKGKSKKSGDSPGPSSSSSKEQAESSGGELPFQVQIEYMDTEGNKALRIITKTLARTADRELAEQNANLAVLGAHAAKTSANLALDGKYSHSRGVALMTQRLAWRSVASEDIEQREQSKHKYKNIFSKLKTMENHLSSNQQRERSTRGHTYSDDENSSDEEMVTAMYCNSAPATRSMNELNAAPPLPARSMSKKLRKLRSTRAAEMDDHMAEAVYLMPNMVSEFLGVSEPPPNTDAKAGEGNGAETDVAFLIGGAELPPNNKAGENNGADTGMTAAMDQAEATPNTEAKQANEADNSKDK